jgi:hypothetical protein
MVKYYMLIDLGNTFSCCEGKQICVCVLTMKTLGLWANGGVAPSTLTLALYHRTEMSSLLHAPASLPQGVNLLAVIK